MSTEPGLARCRTCGSRLSLEDQWCSLCLTPVRQPATEPASDQRPELGRRPEPEPARRPEPELQPEPERPLERARVPVPDAGRLPDRSPLPIDPEVIAVADRMLAELARSSAVARETALHRLIARTAERTGMTPTGAGLLLAAAGAAVFLAGLICVLTVVGLLV